MRLFKYKEVKTNWGYLDKKGVVILHVFPQYNFDETFNDNRDNVYKRIILFEKYLKKSNVIEILNNEDFVNMSFDLSDAIDRVDKQILFEKTFNPNPQEISKIFGNYYMWR